MSDDKIPVDTTIGGANNIGKLKSFKKDKELKDVNVLRVSPTIARQELLSYARLLNRDCWNGQLSDPFIHMDHGGDIKTPARFWLNRVGGMEKPTITYTKARLMGQSIPELYPDLKRCMCKYWYWKETGIEDIDEESEDFEKKLLYVEEKADPRFIRESFDTSDNSKKLEKRSETQAFIDIELLKLSKEDLQTLIRPNKLSTTEDRARRKEIYAAIDQSHAELMSQTTSKKRFLSPPNVMTKEGQSNCSAKHQLQKQKIFQKTTTHTDRINKLVYNRPFKTAILDLKLDQDQYLAKARPKRLKRKVHPHQMDLFANCRLPIEKQSPNAVLYHCDCYQVTGRCCWCGEKRT